MYEGVCEYSEWTHITWIDIPEEKRQNKSHQVGITILVDIVFFSQTFLWK